MIMNAPETEMRQHTVFDNCPVEVTAGDVHAAAGIDFAITRITQAHHRDIECAPAEVKDDHILRFPNRLFVIQCCSDWLEFKVYLCKASFIGGLPECFLCLVILFR